MKDRLFRERERLATVWQSLGPEQTNMRAESERLNVLTKELEAYRSECTGLENACKLAGYYSDSVNAKANARVMFDNAMAREGLLVEVCKVENMIKDSLDVTERLLEKEKKELHQELERVRMEKFWNLADGFRKRNVALSPVEILWLDEVHKIDEDILKVRELRNLCWQRMHVDAQKLDSLRLLEKQRQERQGRDNVRQRERQERLNREREHERQKQQQNRQQSHPEQPPPRPQQHQYQQQRHQPQQQQNPRSYQPQPERERERAREHAPRPTHGYATDAGPRTRTHFERKLPYSRPEMKKAKPLSDEMILAEAWRSYTLRWVSLTQADKPTTPLTYTSIPWPVAAEPFYPSTLTPERMAGFILSTVHSPAKSGMERIREAMKLWHPDKFEGKFMDSIVPADRAVVREGLGVVARGLIELMRMQKKFSS